MAVPHPPEEPPLGAPAWIVTFTDMMSLLLTFFVLLLTFTTKETEKLNQMSGALSAQFGGVGPPGQIRRAVHSPDNPGKGPKGAHGDAEAPLRQEFERELDARVQDRSIFSTRIGIDDVLGGFRLKIEPTSGGEVFELGTGEIEPTTAEVLREVATFMSGQRVRILVHVHVDSVTWKYSRAKTAWELTALQADAVARVLEAGGMTPELVGIVPHGDATPLVPGDQESALRRADNRRLELFILPLEKDPLFDAADAP